MAILKTLSRSFFETSVRNLCTFSKNIFYNKIEWKQQQCLRLSVCCFIVKQWWMGGKGQNNGCWDTEMKGITRCKLTIISESAVCKKFLGQIWSYAASHSSECYVLIFCLHHRFERIFLSFQWFILMNA